MFSAWTTVTLIMHNPADAWNLIHKNPYLLSLSTFLLQSFNRLIQYVDATDPPVNELLRILRLVAVDPTVDEKLPASVFSPQLVALCRSLNIETGRGRLAVDDRELCNVGFH